MGSSILFFIFGSIVGWQIDILSPDARPIILQTATLGLLAALVLKRALLSYFFAIVLGLAAHAPPFLGQHSARILLSNSCVSCRTPTLVESEGNTYLATGFIRTDTSLHPSKKYVDDPLATSAMIAPPKFFFQSGQIFFETLGQALNRKISMLLEDEPHVTAEWYRSLILGEPKDLSKDIKTAFIETGIYHVLAVSGLHLTVAAGILLLLQKIIVTGMCALIPILKKRKVLLVLLSRSVVVVALLIYSYCVHFPQSVQRAFLLFAVDQILRSTFGGLPLVRRLPVVAMIHILIFPIGFLSIGNTFSWLAYSIVALGLKSGKPWLAAIQRQVTLCITCLALTGQLSFSGLLVNFFVIPIFPFLLSGILINLILEGLGCTYFSECFSNLNKWFLITILNLHEVLESFYVSIPFSDMISSVVRLIAYLAVFILALRIFSNRSITWKDRTRNLNESSKR